MTAIRLSISRNALCARGWDGPVSPAYFGISQAACEALNKGRTAGTRRIVICSAETAAELANEMQNYADGLAYEPEEDVHRDYLYMVRAAASIRRQIAKGYLK